MTLWAILYVTKFTAPKTEVSTDFCWTRVSYLKCISFETSTKTEKKNLWQYLPLNAQSANMKANSFYSSVIIYLQWLEVKYFRQMKTLNWCLLDNGCEWQQAVYNLDNPPEDKKSRVYYL